MKGAEPTKGNSTRPEGEPIVVPGNVEFKKHSRFYYWWQNKLELWYLFRKGKFFIQKELLEGKEVISTWYLEPLSNDWSNTGIKWVIKPTLSWNLFWGVILVKRLQKKETNKEGIRYSLILIEDYFFIEDVTNGKTENSKQQ